MIAGNLSHFIAREGFLVQVARWMELSKKLVHAETVLDGVLTEASA